MAAKAGGTETIDKSFVNKPHAAGCGYVPDRDESDIDNIDAFRVKCKKLCNIVNKRDRPGIAI